MKTLNHSFLNHVFRSWLQLSEIFLSMSFMFCDEILPNYIPEIPSLLLSTRIIGFALWARDRMFTVEIQSSSFCQPFYLWSQEEYRNFMPGCPWEEELKYTRAVCDEVGAISLHLFLMFMFVTYLGSNISPSKVIYIN